MTDRPILFSAAMILALLDGTKTQTRRVLKRSGATNLRLLYAPGDRLWVREAFTRDGLVSGCAYRATDIVPAHIGKVRWIPSIHMPRNFSRLTLIVESVKVERLQDISEEDAIAEGCTGFVGRSPRYAHVPPTQEFRDLWNSVHGPGSWDANPWVAAISFSVIRENIDVIHNAMPEGGR